LKKPAKFPRKKLPKAVKKKLHPNSLANLKTTPSYPPFSATNQPSPEAKSVPKRATRAEVFGAFLEKRIKDPRTGEETNRLAAVMAKGWRMFMDSHGEDDVKPAEFLAFCQFAMDGYFGKQGEKLTLEDDRTKIAALSSFSRDEILAGVKHGILALSLEDLEKVGELLEHEMQKKRAGEARIINQTN